ncbi:MAG: hypothetical protein IPN51_14980 [Chloracidobacterium sp.]|nr:hypothetical protein [Chloracidobacterium sp.]
MEDLKRLLRYVRPHWFIFVMALIAMVLVAVFETATGALLVPIFDQFLPSQGKGADTIFDLNSLIPKDDWLRAWIVISSLLFSFTICKGIAEYFSSYLMAKIGQTAILSLRQELYDHLLNQSASFFEKHRTNFLVSRLIVNCAAIELAVSANLRDVLRESFMLICFISAAFYFNWRLMLGAMLLGPVIGLLTSQFSRRLRALSHEAVEGNKSLTDTAQEAIANQQIVKAYVAEDRENRRFTKMARVISSANLRGFRIAAISPPTIDIIGVIALVVLFYFGLREINANRMESAQFFGFLFFYFEATTRCARSQGSTMRYQRRSHRLATSGTYSMSRIGCPKSRMLPICRYFRMPSD